MKKIKVFVFRPLNLFSIRSRTSLFLKKIPGIFQTKEVTVDDHHKVLGMVFYALTGPRVPQGQKTVTSGVEIS